MKPKIYLVISLLMLALATWSYSSFAQSPDISLTMSALDAATDAFAPGELLVKFKPAVNRFGRAALQSRYHLTEIKRITGIDVHLMAVPEGREKEIIAALRRDPRVLYAEPNYYRRAYFTPNDPYYSYQWHFPQIQMGQAWDISTGAGVVVAILDTGVAYENYSGYDSGIYWEYQQAPDLANTNFTAGYDIINNDAHPNDNEGHGTHVAGTIAQSTNNGRGTAGVAYGATIMPIKVLAYDGWGTDDTIIGGIGWATDHGAQVINMSLGGEEGGAALEDAVNYAYSRNVVIVAASGNGGDDSIGDPQVDYPAAYANCIAVGAVRYDETRSDYSNYGAVLDVVAPGGDVGVDQNGDGYPDGILQQTFYPSPTEFDYYYFQGTSMATPHVAGVAALLIARGTALGYTLTPGDVRYFLQTTAKDKGAPGWDWEYGAGLVQAYDALMALAPPATATPTATATNTPTNTPTATPTHTPTATPTNTPTPAVEVAKSVSDTNPPYPESDATPRPTLVYEVLLDNKKKHAVTIYLTDTLNAHLTYVTDSATAGMNYDAASRSLLWNGELGAGAQQNFSFTVRVLTGTREGTYIVNRVSVHDGTGVVGDGVGTLLGEARLYLPLITKNYAGPTPIPTETPTSTDTPVPSPTDTPVPATATPIPPSPTLTFEDRVIELTNQQRANAGLPPLNKVTELMNSAEGHSLDMATNNFFSHTGSDGSNAGERMTRAGYNWWTWGENIAAGYSSPESVVEGWMNSEGHRANILDSNFQDIGVGYVYNSAADYGHYWTQNFGARAGMSAVVVSDTITIPLFSEPLSPATRSDVALGVPAGEMIVPVASRAQ